MYVYPYTDDKISITCTAMIIDDLISQSSANLNLLANGSFNQGDYELSSPVSIYIMRSGMELPSLSFTTAYIENNIQIFTSQ